MNNISSFLKFHRKRLKLTQEELALKAGVGIRFIRELEQGKESVQLDKVNQVLTLFGYNLAPAKQDIDPYDILWNHTNKAVKITLKNKVVKYGIIIDEIIDEKENEIWGWKFVPNKNAITYQKEPDDMLTEIILHKDIYTIEEQ